MSAYFSLSPKFPSMLVDISIRPADSLVYCPAKYVSKVTQVHVMVSQLMTFMLPSLVPILPFPLTKWPRKWWDGNETRKALCERENPAIRKMAAGAGLGSDWLGTVGSGGRRAVVSITEKDREHISKVLEYKEEGNTLFRAGATREAMKQYHNAMMYLKVFDDDMYVSALSCETQSTSLSRMPEEAKQQVIQLNVSIANNLAG